MSLSSDPVWSQDSRHGNCFPSSSDFNSKMVSIYQFDWHLKSDEGRGIQTVIQSGPQASKFSPGVSTLSFLQPSMSFLEEQQGLWEKRFFVQSAALLRQKYNQNEQALQTHYCVLRFSWKHTSWKFEKYSMIFCPKMSSKNLFSVCLNHNLDFLWLRQVSW